MPSTWELIYQDPPKFMPKKGEAPRKTYRFEAATLAEAHIEMERFLSYDDEARGDHMRRVFVSLEPVAGPLATTPTRTPFTFTSIPQDPSLLRVSPGGVARLKVLKESERPPPNILIR